MRDTSRHCRIIIFSRQFRWVHCRIPTDVKLFIPIWFRHNAREGRGVDVTTCQTLFTCTYASIFFQTPWKIERGGAYLKRWDDNKRYCILGQQNTMWTILANPFPESLGMIFWYGVSDSNCSNDFDYFILFWCWLLHEVRFGKCKVQKYITKHLMHVICLFSLLLLVLKFDRMKMGGGVAYFKNWPCRGGVY